MGYAHEKLYVAVIGMAQSPAALPQRLADAYISSLIRLKSEDFPPDLRGKFEELTRLMTSKEAVGDEGNVHATVNQMTAEEADRAAHLVINLFDLLPDD